MTTEIPGLDQCHYVPPGFELRDGLPAGFVSHPCNGGSVFGPSDLAVGAHMAKVMEKQRREAGWPKNRRQAMTTLCRLFPTLRDEASGFDPWNTDDFLLWTVNTGACSGAMHAARFVLSVWNPNTNFPQLLKDKAARDKPEDPDDAKLWKGLRKLRERVTNQLKEEKRADAREHRGMPDDVRPAEVIERLHEWLECAGPFNLSRALGVWDEQHRAAFVTWCEAPFWP